MRTSKLAQWFGSNVAHAEVVGSLLGKLRWCGVPFVGGCCELPHIRTRSGIANDLHRDVINLYRVIRGGSTVEILIQRLVSSLYHPDVLKEAQEECRTFRREWNQGDLPNVDWALAYFLTSWLGRGGMGGTKRELDQTLAIRWDFSGGGCNRKFRGKIETLHEWSKALSHWEFTCRDAFVFIDRIYDRSGCGVYVDSPWPDVGKLYSESFNEKDLRRLAKVLGEFKQAVVVVRFGDHPLIRELYPESKWDWCLCESRNQQGKGVAEVFLRNRKNSGVV